MSIKTISSVLVAFALSLSSQAQADWKIADNYKQSAETDIYLAAALNAYTAANTDLEGFKKAPLYCQPLEVNLGAKDAVAIFEKELEYRLLDGSKNSPFWKETNLEYVLLWGLQRTYPCAE